jgi:predicted nucleic acid-binding protein
MPLNMAAGTRCFIDANIFYYHGVETPTLSDPCSDLLRRVGQGEVLAFTSIHVLAEAVHKAMLAEAASRFGLTRTGLVGWLQRNRERIAELHVFRDLAAEFGRMSLSVLTPDLALLEEATAVSTNFRLLTNDALVVALMRRDGLTDLVTNDDDFDGVPGLTVWKPR